MFIKERSICVSSLVLLQSDNDHLSLDYGLRFSVCRIVIDLSLKVALISVNSVNM